MSSYFGCCAGTNRKKLASSKDAAVDNVTEDLLSEDDEATQVKAPTQDSAAKQQCLHLFPGEEKAYELKSKIGSGGFGEVYDATCSEMNGEEVAVKILDLDNAGCDYEEIMNEVNLMCNIKHPNCLDLHATFPVDNKLWMVMPYIRYGSVRQILDFAKPLAGSGGFNDEKLIATIMKQTLEALNYCHSQPHPIVHRDVKAANILIDESGHCLLMDFGVSKSLEDHTTKKHTPGKLKRTNSYVGTASWMAPEVAAVDMKEDGSCTSSAAYGTKADIWSFGITMLELAYGCPPHGNDGEAEFRELTISKKQSKDRKSLIKKKGEFTKSYSDLSARDRMSAVAHGPVVYKNMKNRQSKMSKKFQELVDKCLQIDPDARPTAKDLLKKSFFKSNAQKSEYIAKNLLAPIPRDYLSTGGRSTPAQKDALKNI